MRAKYITTAVATLAVAGAVCTAWMSRHPSANGAGSGSSQAYAASPSVSEQSGRSAQAGMHPARQWKTGDSFLYAVETVRRASVGGGSQTAQNVLTKLAGTLALTVTGQDTSGVQIRRELRLPRYEVTPRPEEDSSASLVKPFYFENVQRAPGRAGLRRRSRAQSHAGADVCAPSPGSDGGARGGGGDLGRGQSSRR